jgi:uncharacterized protein YoxC
MAWDVAAYAITIAVLAIGAACIMGIVRICQSLRHLDDAVKALGEQTEASLLQCTKLAAEATSAIADARQSFQGLSTFTEGARSLGEAVQSAAQAVARVTAYYRDRLTPSNRFSPETRDPSACEQPELTDIGRSLLSLWKRRAGKDRASES